MKLLVTGGAGFIGANLCRTLAAHDAIGEVVALDNLSTGFRHNLDGVDASALELARGAPERFESGVEFAIDALRRMSEGKVTIDGTSIVLAS